jgi:D-xylose 1-dehydrogenase (NADP+, D-xylono-1,5-lactone-forming)
VKAEGPAFGQRVRQCGSSSVGSGFRFAAEALARMVEEHDHAAIERAAIVSLDNAATLEAMAHSARLEQAVDVPVRAAA